MKSINTVSETALLTLRSRIVESFKRNPILIDPVGKECLDGLADTLPEETRKRILERKLSPFLTRHLALRARKYDDLCRDFLAEYPDGLIVNLGCGFDTRFWRLGLNEQQYVELDLPEVIELKGRILGEKIKYRTLKGSVLDEAWVNDVKSLQGSHILFLAEGLFMYFQPGDSIQALNRIAGSFDHSRLVMEVVHHKYTVGMYKRMVERKMRKRAGSEAGDYFLFGIKKAQDLEGYHQNFRIRSEWSFFQDNDFKPSFLKVFKHIRSVSKSQYTVIADIQNNV